MYEPSGGSHPGCSNDNLYFATTHLDDLRNIENERVITNSGHERNIIFKDGTEWKWYYSDEADEYNNAIKLRTHPITASDTIPPTLSNPFPTGELSSGTTSTDISLETNETATCKYGTLASVPYDEMPNTFTTTGGMSHSTTVSGLENGGSYTYYVRCKDAASNANPDDYPITFSVAEPLVLHGAPADEIIYLSWTVNTTLPVTSTWRLAYDGPTGDQPSPITGIVSPTRA